MTATAKDGQIILEFAAGPIVAEPGEVIALLADQQLRDELRRRVNEARGVGVVFKNADQSTSEMRSL